MRREYNKIMLKVRCLYKSILNNWSRANKSDCSNSKTVLRDICILQGASESKVSGTEKEEENDPFEILAETVRTCHHCALPE